MVPTFVLVVLVFLTLLLEDVETLKGAQRNPLGSSLLFPASIIEQQPSFPW